MVTSHFPVGTGVVESRQSGVQLGIFEGRGPIHEKDTLQRFKENTAGGLISILLLGWGCKSLIYNMITEAKRAPSQW